MKHFQEHRRYLGGELLARVKFYNAKKVGKMQNLLSISISILFVVCKEFGFIQI
jgi:hypothetical protein